MPVHDYSDITVRNLAFAKRKLEIPGPSPPIANLLVVPITAAENIPAFAPVTSQGKVADSANPSLSFRRTIGIAITAIAGGSSGMVIVAGIITNPTWAWTSGDPIYLNGTGLSSMAPATGFVQQIGSAKANDTIIVEFGEPMLL